MVATPQIDNLLQEIQSKPDNRIKNDIQSKETVPIHNRHPVSDQLDASSATSFCLDESPREGFSFPPVCLDNNVQVDPRDNFLIAENVDALMPDALLSRGMASGKGMCTLTSGQRDHRDVENELSSAAFSSQSFGVPDMSFKPGCSSDVAVTDAGMPSQGLWNNQTQRMRTFTKVGTVLLRTHLFWTYICLRSFKIVKMHISKATLLGAYMSSLRKFCLIQDQRAKLENLNCSC